MTTDRPSPAGLVRILLLRAGIESNPGPTPGTIFNCNVCKIKLHPQSKSVQCSLCQNWIHYRKEKTLNCSNLKSINHYTPNYTCLTCNNLLQPNTQNTQPTPTQTSPSQPRQPNPTYQAHPTPPYPTNPTQPPIPPNPNPTPNVTEKFNLKILQFNCNGLNGKWTQLLTWMNDNDIKLAALQETKLGKKSKLSTSSQYTLVRKDRQKDKGGGLAFLVHKTIMFQTLPDPPADPHLEYQAIQVNKLKIINMYIPPSSSCSPGYSPSLTPYLNDDDLLILGDMNAHDPLWFSPISDTRGSTFSDEIGSSNLATLNDDNPTRLPSNGQPTSPDISLASLSLLPYITWNTHTNLGSDHLPITYYYYGD